MRFRLALAPLALIFALVSSAWANPGAPNFGAALYGDGEVWGTKGAAALPAPNGHNNQSFDMLFVFVNGAAGQLAVAEAAPGNPAFNGGRWATQTAMWTQAGLDFYGSVPVLMSYEDIQIQESLGYLSTASGSPNPDMTPDYFECPLLPVH